MTRNERTHLVATAALLHDIGKIGQRAAADGPDDQTVAEFCPKDPATSRPSHLHAAWTGWFVERHLRTLWEGRGAETVLGWAARHHCPSTPLEWVVAEADRLSSGMDRPENEDLPSGGPAMVAVESVISRVSKDREANTRSGGAFLPMSDFALDRASLFPGGSGTVGPEAYRNLWEGLGRGTKAVDSLASRPESGPMVEAVMHLLERHASGVPASTVSSPRDVSLFDHARSASALAACISFDDRCETEEGFVRDRSDPRYALVCADISGIQGYLHALKSEGARRSLTGRSFYVQLLQDAIASCLVARWNLPPTCVLYQGGGKIWLLLPSAVLDEVRTFAEEVDLSLWNETGGLLGLGIGFDTLCGNDFIEHQIGVKWASALNDLKENRLRRLVTRGYDDVFQPREFGRYECEQCGRETNDRQCSHCTLTEEIGRRLGRTRVIHRLVGKRPPDKTLKVPMPSPLDVTYVFEGEDGPPTLEGTVALSVGWPLESEVLADAREGRARVFWPLATSEPVEFARLAEQNPGVPRLGILRADVDSLGDLFERGLREDEQTLSRLAALSRSLNVFFGAYVPNEVRKRWPDTVRVVFSGGDDCFLVGSFHVMPEVSKWLRDEFRAYGAENPALSISAGIAIQGENAPLITTARRALDAERKAKAFERGTRKKDALCLFDVPVSWLEVERAGALVSRLVASIRELSPAHAGLSRFEGPEMPWPTARLPRALLQTLAQIASLHLDSRGRPSLDQAVNSHRWMWIAHYALTRAAEGCPGARSFLEAVRLELLQTGAAAGADARALIDYLSVVVEWAFLLTRPGR